MRLQATFAALLALGAAACSGGQTKAPDSIDRMSKAEVESIVKEYLLREPEILFEMQAAYQTNQLATQTLAAEGAWDKLIASSKDVGVTPKVAAWVRGSTKKLGPAISAA